MDSVCIPVVSGNDVAKSFFLNKLSGFYEDKMTDHTAIALELMDDGTYVMLSKRRKVIEDVAPAPPVTPTKAKLEIKAASPDAVTAPPSPPATTSTPAADATETGAEPPTTGFDLSGLVSVLPTPEDIEAELMDGDEIEPGEQTNLSSGGGEETKK